MERQTREWTQRLKERERERAIFSLSLVILSSSVVFRRISSLFDCTICTRMLVSRFHFHTHTRNATRVRSKRCNYSNHWRDCYSFSLIKNRVFRRKALTISTHRTSFSRFWRSSFLQLLVINRFIDEYAICMYACFTRMMIYISYTNCAIHCPSQTSRERKKGRRKCVIFYLRDCTRRTRSRTLNPEIQSRRTRRKGYTHHFARAHDKRTTLIIIIMYTLLYSPRAASSIPTWPMRFSRTIPCMHQLRRYPRTLWLRAFTRTYTYTHTHARLDVEVRCLIYYTLS